MTKHLRLWLLGLLGSLAFTTPVSAASFDADPSSSCAVRVHYPQPVAPAAEVFVLAVGTAMSRSSYDSLGAQLNGKGYVLVAMDHERGNLTKTDAGKFRACLDLVKGAIGTWLAPVGFTSAAHWIVGGHSAGGQAAHYALAADPAIAHAVFSVDPYNLSGAPIIPGPALYWGFDVTTCFVGTNDAAKAGYYRTSGRRAFVRVNRVYSWGPCGYSPKYFHCSFCDGHCPGCTNCMLTPSHFFADVGGSVQRFVNAAFYGVWSKPNLAGTMTTPIKLFVDGDAP